MSNEILQAILAGDDSGSDVFNQAERQTLLDTIEDIGNLQDACAECRVTEAQLVEALEQDPKLGEEIAMAQGRFQSKLRRRFRDLAMEGVETPIIGGKKRDKVVTTMRVPDARAMDIVSKLHFQKDMAQYTRAQVETKDVTKKEKPDGVDLNKLTRQERTLFDQLVAKATGQPLEIEGETE